MIETTLWHPVAAAADLHAAPLAAVLLDREIVLWRDASGTARALADRCPHRGTRLSLGAVQQGCIECPYHGWRFEGDGRCIVIPALPGFTPAAAQAATPHAVREAHGLVWVRLEGDGGAPPATPGVPGREVVCGPYDVATSAPRLVENFLDTSHFAFVHAGSLGDRRHAEVPAYGVAADAEGRPGVPAYRAWQPRATAASSEGSWVTYRYQVLHPFAALLEKQTDAGQPREAYALWVCASGPESSRVWFTIYTDDTTADAARLRAFQDGIFGEDRPVLESQRPRRLPVRAGGEAHSAADRLSAAYRRYLFESGITFGVC